LRCGTTNDVQEMQTTFVMKIIEVCDNEIFGERLNLENHEN
jgi:hypothetical protein